MRSTFLDPATQATLERDGYATIPFLSLDEVAVLRNGYERLGRAPGDPERACISTFHTYDADYKQATSDEILRVFEPHLDRVFDRQRALPANYLVKWPGGMSGFGLHHDLTLVDERHHRSVEVWVALEETHQDNGQLWMVPGSHAWVPTLRGIHAFPVVFAGLERRIVERHAVPVPLRPGEAVVFTHATMHFSYPNRTDRERMVAITDLIPEEATHLHFFGNPDGTVEGYEIDDSFWVDNNPFTLATAPPKARSIGVVDFSFHPLTDAILDRLVDEGRAVDREPERRGAINPGRAWCHRCGTTDDVEGSPDRWAGNVTLLCAACRVAEPALVAS